MHPKSDSQRKSLLEAVKEILLFRSLESEQLNEVLDAMFERKVTPNEYIIKQGDDGDNFYVVERLVAKMYYYVYQSCETTLIVTWPKHLLIFF